MSGSRLTAPAVAPNREKHGKKNRPRGLLFTRDWLNRTPPAYSGGMGGAALSLVAALALCWSTTAFAEASLDQTAVPAPYWAKSIAVVNDGAPLMLEPDSESRRRGTVGAGTRIGFKRRVFGKGCSTGVWYETIDSLYICEANVEPSPASPGPQIDEWAGSNGRLPQRYAFVKFDGTRAYAHPSDYFRNDYVEALGKGFGIVVTGEQVYEGQEPISAENKYRTFWRRFWAHFFDGFVASFTVLVGERHDATGLQIA